MKTAMQDLKEDLELAIESANDALNDINDEQIRNQCKLVVKITIGDILKRINTELLHIEKKQIIDSNQAGWQACRRDIDQNAQDYYNETFK